MELNMEQIRPVENSEEINKKELENAFKKAKGSKKNIIFLVTGAILAVVGVILAILPFVLPKETLADLTFPTIPSKADAGEKYYSKLTGKELASAEAVTAPTFCIQTPNGTDGARPQAGMHQAGVVFEAIAESGITRFAAIYQDPTSAVIGPLRSLRLYYLQWDTPFDCAIVHAGGADDALAAVRSGGYRDLTENYAYMYRGAYPNYDRLWNNLFTNASLLKQYASDTGFTSSNINGFSRMTPEESLKSRVDATVSEILVITEPATKNTSEIVPSTTSIGVNFGNYGIFNVVYDYDKSTNTYNRSYAYGEPHYVYSCPEDNLGEVTPESSCELKQMSPSVVAAIVVEEHIAWDNYHEDITAVGSGDAVVFQNGVAIRGRWEKASVADQIKFTDENGAEIKLAPGQTFVEAVPQYGSIEY